MDTTQWIWVAVAAVAVAVALVAIWVMLARKRDEQHRARAEELRAQAQAYDDRRMQSLREADELDPDVPKQRDRELHERTTESGNRRR
jgi:hypothetical protein